MPVLDETLADYENVEVINEDVLKLNLKKLIEERNGSGKVKVVANLHIILPLLSLWGFLKVIFL